MRSIKKWMCTVLAASMVMTAGVQTVIPTAVSAAGTRYMEALDRGLVAVKTAEGVYLSWRLVGTENYNSVFTIYKDGRQLTTVSDSTNYLDTSGNMNSRYSVFSSSSSIKCDVVTAFSSGSNYFDIPAAPIADYIAPDGTAYPYEIKDASVGDLDGDGQYEIVVKREANRQHAGVAGFNHMFLEAYKMNGDVLWRIDMGQNMRAMTEFAFLVYDFNKDGIAEIACKTAPGTKDGLGKYVTEASNDWSIKNANNYADYHDANGYLLTGPEYFTLFGGRNGAALDTIMYPILRGTDSANNMNSVWGDNYGHRAEKCMATVAYLDGVNPSIVVWRGIYPGQSSKIGPGRTALAAVNVSTASRMTVGNRFDTWSQGKGYTSGNEQYIGQGNHSLAVGDVDNDGCDEVISGGLCIDHDMKAKWCTYRGHGDAHHLADYDPTNNSLEYFTVHEEGGTKSYIGQSLNYGMTVIDASNGTQKFHVGADGDTGRGIMANVGAGGYYQFWGAGVYKGLGNNSFAKSSFPPPSSNFRIFWDGDLYDELLDAVNPAKDYRPAINSYNTKRAKVEQIYCDDNSKTINGTKAVPILQADIFGDWREEFISLTNDGLAMRVHTTNIPTTNKLYTLMHDSVYRMGVALQNQYYNQPPHIGYYVSDSYDSYDKRAVKPSITTVSYNGGWVQSAIPVESGVKTRNSSYVIDEDGDYYPTHTTVASPTLSTDVWSCNGYTYAFMSSASGAINNLWKANPGVSMKDGRFLMFAANGKASTFTAKNNSKSVTGKGKVEFDLSVPTTYSTDGYKVRGNADTFIYVGDGTQNALTFKVSPTMTDSYVTGAVISVNDNELCKYSSGEEAQAWTHIECTIDNTSGKATVKAVKSNGSTSTKSVTYSCSNVNTFAVNPGTTWGTILLDAIKVYQAAATPTPAPTATPTPTPTQAPVEAPTANSAPANGKVYYIKSVNSDMYLNVENGSNTNGANVQQKTFDGSDAQKFKLVDAGNGYYNILTACSDYTKAVDVNKKSTENGTNIIIWAAGTGTNQQFKFEKQADGSYAILTRVTSDKSCLDVANISKESGANIQQYAFWGGDGQKWLLAEADGIVNNGVYAIKNVNSGMYLDIVNGANANGTNVQQHPGNGATAQQFKVVEIEDGYYQLLAGCTDYKLAVDVSGRSSADGANILLWTAGTAWNQQYRLERQDDGSYAILTRISDCTKGLDVENMSKTKGANVQQYSYWGGDGQKWIFERVK